MTLYTLTGGQTVDASGDPAGDYDAFYMSKKDNVATGHDGTDSFHIDGKANTIFGGLGDDEVNHTSGLGGSFDGGAGNDSLFGLAGDELIGGDGQDLVVVDLRADDADHTLDLSGFSAGGEFDLPDATRIVDVEYLGVGLGAGDDVVSVGDEDFTLVNGGDGGDSLTGGSGNDNLYGGGGSDTVVGGGGSDFLYAFATWIYSIPPGTDAGGSHDSLFGGDGSDFLGSSHGADTLNGGDGTDTVDFEFNVKNGVTAKLANGDGKATGDGVDTLISIENLSGSSQSDHLIGDKGANYLYGEGGADTLEGGRGGDNLYGGSGDGMADTFVYRTVADSRASSQDYVGQFETGIDKIDLHLIDADGDATNGDTAFSFGNHLGHAGDAKLTYDGTYSQILGDTDGNGTADLVINIFGQIVVGDIIV